MGNGESAHLSAKMTKAQVFDQLRPLGAFSYSFFRQEHVISTFYHPTVSIKKEEFQSHHKPSQLASLILGCYEQLDNIPEIIETIIQLCQEPENELVIQLSHSFDLYALLANSRSIMILNTQQFSPLLFTPFLEKPAKATKYVPTIANILRAFSFFNETQFKNFSKHADVESVANHYRTADPATAFPPPTPEFLPSQVGHTELFTARSIFSHATASSGQYLFVLCSDGLQIFPLFNMGSLISPITRKLELNFDDSVSLTADKTNIYIYKNDVMYELKIFDIFNKRNNHSTKQIQPGYICYVSDGIVTVRLDNDFSATVMQNGKVIRKIKLVEGNEALNPSIPTLFPHINYKLVPIETNGAFLSFMFRINPTTVIYRVFSLITGRHIHDDVFYSPDYYFSAVTDSINRCHWVISLFEGNKLGVRRYYFAGSINPSFISLNADKKSKSRKQYKKFITDMHTVVTHYIGTQVIPATYLTDSDSQLNELLRLTKTYLGLSKQELAVEILVIILELNLKKTRASSELREKVIEIILLLPQNLAVLLFFNTLQITLYEQTKKSISILVDLISKMKNETMITFALSKIESCCLFGNISFTLQNDLSDLLPSDSRPESSMSSALHSLLLIHQRVLITTTNQYIKKDKFDEIQFQSSKNPTTPLDFLIDYSKTILTKFQIALTTCSSDAELDQSLILSLLYNFFNLLSSLSSFHVVARFLTETFTGLLDKINVFIEKRQIDINSSTNLTNILRLFLFVYGKLSSTLIRGTSMTNFEQHFVHLIRANLDANKDLLENNFHGISETSQDFIKNETRSEPIMALIYSKFKPFMHKNLTPELKTLDKLALTAACKHLNTLDSLFKLKFPFPPSIKSALDQMLKVRNAYRAKKQQHNANELDEFRLKCLMLLKMNANENTQPNEISDFICSKESATTILNLLMRQTIRENLTGFAFTLVESVLSLEKKLFADIFSFSLSQIENFEGLASIFRITGGSKLTQVDKFFSRILNIIKRQNESRLILFCFRFFRDCSGLVDTIQNPFLNGILSIFCSNDDNYALFALALSLVTSAKELTGSLQNPKQSAMGRLLQYCALTNVQATTEFYNSFREEFWTCPPTLERILCRVMFRVLNSTLLNKETIRNEFRFILKTIGKLFIEFSDIKIANELIWVLRRVLTEDAVSKPILIDLMLKADRSDAVLISGIFAVLGNSIESIRPFCNIKAHTNRSSVAEYIAVPTSKSSAFFCYERPFDLNRPPFQLNLTPQNLIYAVSVVKVDEQSFHYFEYILSFFDDIFQNLASIKAALYVQVLANFMQYPEFVKKLTTPMIDKLSETPLPFHTIYTTINNIRSMQPLATLQQIDGFDQILYKPTPNSFISYVSPQIKPKAKFTIKFTVSPGTPKVYFGIINNPVERYFSRFSVVSAPDGIWYPYNQNICKFSSMTEFSFDVDAEKLYFTVSGHSLEFPRGESFRVIIAAPKTATVHISYPQNENIPFDLTASPAICPHGGVCSSNKQSLYKLPSSLSDKVPKNSFSADLSSFVEIATVIEPLSIGYKVKNCFSMPPDYLVIHCGFSSDSSFQIVAENIRGLFKSLSLQWTTVCLMRLAAIFPKKINHPAKLFTLCTIPLEPFNINQFNKRKFPFNYEHIRTSPNSLYLSLESDAIKAIDSLMSVDKIVDTICKSLLKMSEYRNLHLLIYPHINHKYFPPGTFGQSINLNSTPAVVTINSFIPLRFLAIKRIGETKKEALPRVFCDGNDQMELNPELLRDELSIFAISTTDNSFAFDSAFELMLNIKNVAYYAKSSLQKCTLKSAFANMVIAQSPFVYRYLPGFSEFIEILLNPSPFDVSPKYLEKLFIMGGILKKSRMFDNFEFFMQQEAHVLGSSLFIEICKHFPEFLFVQTEKPKAKMCTIPIVSLDPGTIKSNFAQHIRMIQLFSMEYKSLVNFPFWEILPYWLRISGAWRTSNNSGKKKGDPLEADEIDPFVEPNGQDVMHISNPTGQKISIHLRMNPQIRLSQYSMLMMSPTPDFENATFISGRNLFKTIDITGQHQFLSLIDIPGGWNSARIEFTNWKRYRPPPPEKINIDAIHDAFIADMTEFAVNWKSENTEELIMSLPRYALIEPTFVTTETIAKSCALTHMFSTNVVVLRALLIQHFNYIRTKYKDAVPRSLWESMKSFISSEDAADEIVKSIATAKDAGYAQFVIDRRAAQRLSVEHRGDYTKSFVTQLSVAFRKVINTDPNLLRNKRRPWKIKFEGESAVDAGGPGRELMALVAASIFEPTTQLFIPVPDSARNEGQYKDTFIPLDKTFRRAEDYMTIGRYLGIVLRTGFSQDLPFAPIVWKYLAHEKLNAEDIYEIDSQLRDQMNVVEQICEQGNLVWKFTQWNGQQAYLPGHDANQLVRVEEADQYVREVIQCRIDMIKPMMKMIRNGLSENVGFKKHPLLTGKLLSRMAQGSSLIATEHLKSITVVSDYDGMNDPYVQRFWRVVDKFNSEQKKLLLKFITTFTRLPNPSINPDFRLQIDKMNTNIPDECLPTAATCFNKLHLPSYSTDDICAEKVLYAIQFCQSMENK